MAESVIRKHYMLEMRLDLSSVDTDALTAIAGRMNDVGLVVSTLQQEIAADLEAEERAYQCHMTCRRRQPPAALRQEPIPFDRWQKSIVRGPDALPDAYFIAKRGPSWGDYVGMCLLGRLAERPGALISGFTGTLPAWGGKGIAKALKAHALLYAVRHGYQSVETSNLQINRRMYTLNRALGFQVVRRRLHTYRIPLTERDGAKTPARS